MRRYALVGLSIATALLAWRFYLLGPAPMDAEMILRGWSAFAAGINPYAADFGVNYPPALQWLGGLVTAALGPAAALVAYRCALVVGCILGLVGIARLARLPTWAVVVIGAAGCPPLLEGWSLGNPGPAIAGLGIWALSREDGVGLGASLALKPLLLPAWIARCCTHRATAALAALAAAVLTLPAIGLSIEWLRRVHEWEPVWAASRGRGPLLAGLPASVRMLAIGVSLGWAGRRWAWARRPEVLCAGSFFALPVLWDHSQFLLVPAVISGAAWLVRESRVRRVAVPLVASLMLVLSFFHPAKAGWTKQKNDQCSGKTSLDCVPCGTRVICRDQSAGSSSGSNRLIDIASDYTVTVRNSPSLGNSYNTLTSLGCKSDGSRIYLGRSDNDNYYSDSPFSSWTTWDSFQSTLVGYLPQGGTHAVQFGVDTDNWSPPRLYGVWFNTSMSRSASYIAITTSGACPVFPGGSHPIFASGCWRTATVFDALGSCRDARLYYSHVYSVGNDSVPISQGTTSTISGSDDVVQALHCSSDGATSITGIRAGTARTLVIRRGAVTRSDEVATPLVGTYSGTGFEGTTGRYLISTAGALWKDQDAAAPADMAGTSYDITLDGGDSAASLSNAPDGTTPMVVTASCDIWTWAASAATPPRRRSTLSGTLSGSMRGGS